MTKRHLGSHYRHWRCVDVVDLEKASTFEDLALIAIRVLKRASFASPGRRVVEVCGPISTGGLGSIEANMEHFTNAVSAVIDSGVQVFSQVPFEAKIAVLRARWYKDGNSGYCMPILEDFYRKVFESGLVTEFWFLPGWQNSTGSKWEMKEAHRLGISARDYPANLLVN